MGTIAYSVNGEGRGHATRVQSIVEMLTPKHRFVLLASGDAYDHLSGEYRGHSFVKVKRLPGLRFAYQGEKLDYLRSLMSSIPFLWNVRKYTSEIAALLDKERPALAITDFEPLLPRAAELCRIPWVSLDHQHFLSVSDFSSLPFSLRWQSRFLRCSVRMFYHGQRGEAVSSFAHLPSRRGFESIARMGVMIRKRIEELKERVCEKGHLVVYIRHTAPDSFWDALSKLDHPIYVFGKCVPPSYANIEYFGIQNEAFMEQLACCNALITTAGNQLVGEAFYLGKPVLALPEHGNFEQQVNAWLVSQSRCGWGVEFSKCTRHVLEQFLLSAPLFKENLRGFCSVGNAQAVDFIESFMSTEQVLPTSRLQPQRSVA